MNIQPKYPWHPSTEKPDEGKAIVILTYHLEETSVSIDVSVCYRKGVWPDPFWGAVERSVNFVWAYKAEFCLHQLIGMANNPIE